MKWPEVDPRESFEDIEKRLGITSEIDDVRPSSLGAHPSASFYSQKEPTIDLVRMRRAFGRIVDHY